MISIIGNIYKHQRFYVADHGRQSQEKTTGVWEFCSAVHSRHIFVVVMLVDVENGMCHLDNATREEFEAGNVSLLVYAGVTLIGEP
eukprot:1120695-Pyramimonas_sp.AAC.1